MNVYKVELMIIDFDQLGQKSAIEELENARYANRCISPRVMSVQSADIGEWDDAHPLNNSSTATAEYERLFSKASPSAA